MDGWMDGWILQLLTNIYSYTNLSVLFIEKTAAGALERGPRVTTLI